MSKPLLVAVAFDDLASEVETRAIELARALGRSCLLLHVVEAIEGDDEETRAFTESLTEEASAKLEGAASRFQEGGLDCSVRVLVGRRWQGIVDVAEEEDVSLVVMGSRPTLSEGRPHLGSTSHQVFFASRRPLFVVRRAESRD